MKVFWLIMLAVNLYKLVYFLDVDQPIMAVFSVAAMAVTVSGLVGEFGN